MSLQEGDQIILREIRLPLREPFANASGVQRMRRVLIVQLRALDGTTGWSECVAQEMPNYSPETIDTAWFAIREWFLPALRGAHTASPSEVLDLLDRHVRGHGMAKAALEMVCWDVDAQRQGMSLAELLGGSQRRVSVGVALGIQSDPSELVDRVRACIAKGYRKVKMKIGPGADVRYVAAVREAMGSDVPLAVDANGAYTLDDLDVLHALDDFGLMMIEQPLRPDELVQHAELQRRLSTPVCLDESVLSPAAVETIAHLQSGRIVNVKPGRLGGLTAARAVHDAGHVAGLGLWVGGMLETGIGRAYNVALASLPHFTMPGDLSPSRRYWERDVVTPEWTMAEDGHVEVPFDRPGLGVTVDEDLVADLTVREERFEL